MKRGMFTILSAGSLALWVAVAVLWVGSYWTGAWFGWGDAKPLMWRSVGLSANSGRVGFQWNWWSLSKSLGDGMDLRWLMNDIRPNLQRRHQGMSCGFSQAYAYGQRWDETFWTRLGFTHDVDKSGPDELVKGSTFAMESGSVMAPCWLPLLATTWLPGLWLMRFRLLRRRKKLGLCLDCGYDLRASEGKCPECGLAIPTDLVRKPIA